MRFAAPQIRYIRMSIWQNVKLRTGHVILIRAQRGYIANVANVDTCTSTDPRSVYGLDLYKSIYNLNVCLIPSGRPLLCRTCRIVESVTNNYRGCSFNPIEPMVLSPAPGTCIKTPAGLFSYIVVLKKE